MIRISFTKVQFSKITKGSHVCIQVKTQKGQILKVKPKKIKNNMARFYGDFIQLQNNQLQFQILIFLIEQGKNPYQIEKLAIRRNTYGFKQKKSHVIQNTILKISFDSECINDIDSTMQQDEEDFSKYEGKTMLPQRLCIKKVIRGFSPDQKQLLERFSFQSKNNNSFKNITMVQLGGSSSKRMF